MKTKKDKFEPVGAERMTDAELSKQLGSYQRAESIGMLLGTTTAYKVMVFCPNAQRTNPKYEDVSGRAHVSFDLRLVPGATGNDEVRIILL